MKNRRKTGFAKCHSVGFTSVRQKILVGSMEKSDRRFLVGTTVGEFARDVVPRETNVGFSPHYVKYACSLPRQIAGEREPIVSLRLSDG